MANALWKASISGHLKTVWNVKVKVTQSCPTLCDLVDYTVHGILQARILEWITFPFSRGSSKPRDWTRLPLCRRVLYQLSHQFSSVTSCSLQPHGLWHARLPCPSPTPGAGSNSNPSSRWCHPTISSSVIPFSFCLQSFPASGVFPVSQFFTWSAQSIGVSASASVHPMNIQDWFPLG